MRTAVRAVLLFLGLLGLVILLSTIYTRSIREQPMATAGASKPVAWHPALRDGAAALKAGRLAEAHELLQSVPVDDPSYVVALDRLAEVQHREGNDDAALETAREVVRLQPGNPEACLGLARLHYRMGQAEQAEHAALLALELQPDHSAARYFVALCRAAQGRLPEALRSYDRAIASDTEGNRIVQALAELEQLSTADAQAAVPHYVLAYLATRLGKPDVALEELERFLRLNPEGPAADLARTRLEELREEQKAAID